MTQTTPSATQSPSSTPPPAWPSFLTTTNFFTPPSLFLCSSKIKHLALYCSLSQIDTKPQCIKRFHPITIPHNLKVSLGRFPFKYFCIFIYFTYLYMYIYIHVFNVFHLKFFQINFVWTKYIILIPVKWIGMKLFFFIKPQSEWLFTFILRVIQEIYFY